MTIFEPNLRTSVARSRWLLTGGFILTALAFVVLGYWVTIASAVHLWLTVDTYSYAFAVLPIVAFLVWRNREFFRTTAPAPTLHGALFVLGFSTLWLLGAKIDILELQHIAIPGILIGIIIGAIGWSNAAHFWLPLSYLFLLAPAGTPLLPFLQDVTTVLATALLSIGQIPFYAEGYDIEVATGKYVVAPGCAGLNFILALATVAPLYCEIMFAGFRKRMIVFACMMAFVPIANGIRVFGIIAIAEYSHRAIDISADHLLYGWIFFSAIVLVMFWIGSLFSDLNSDPPPNMPWHNQISLAEFMADPIMIRLRFVLAVATAISLLVPLLQALSAG